MFNHIRSFTNNQFDANKMVATCCGRWIPRGEGKVRPEFAAPAFLHGNGAATKAASLILSISSPRKALPQLAKRISADRTSLGFKVFQVSASDTGNHGGDPQRNHELSSR